MRDAIRQRLIDQIISIGDRVFEPHAAGVDTEKPYIVIAQGSDTEDTPWTGFRRIVEVWPNVSRTTFVTVDSLAGEVAAALDQQLLTSSDGEKFTCLALGPMGDDLVIEDWDVITRCLSFAILAVQPVALPETYDSDPWVDALAVWSEPLLSGWTAYRNKYPQGYVRPSILWRVAGMEITPINAAMFRVQKTMAGHFLGATPNQQTQGVMTVSQELSNAIKVILSTASRQYLTVKDVKINIEADAMKQGQLRVTLSRLTNRPAEETPYIMHIELTEVAEGE